MLNRLTLAAALTMTASWTLADAPIPAGFESAKTETLDVNLHYVRDGGPGETIILVHGWPQTWASWRKVMPLLSPDHDVIAVDLRGINGSDMPDEGYDKATMAQDIRNLMAELEIETANIVGHDVGAMVTFAFAQQFPDATSTATLIDAPIPGTEMFDMISTSPRAWHFSFHNAAMVPEMLTAGKEEEYYGYLIRGFDAGTGAMGADDIAITVEAYSVPETATAGFNFYRTFQQDVEDNRTFMETPLEMPILGLNAGRLAPFPAMVQTMEPLATTVEGYAMDAGHWIPEAEPEALAEAIADFVERH